MKILFLYTEIAEYFISCCNALTDKGVEVHVVRFPVNKEAPFQFKFNKNIHVYERNNYNYDSLKKLTERIQPQIIICSGWIDKVYLKICGNYFRKIITVLTLDNHWNGSLKQRIATAISPYYLKKKFSHCWVPGNKQYEYASKLGFKEKNILTGFYSCDFELFYSQFLLNQNIKKENYPHRFIYVGRYYEFKGIKDLWSAFIDLQNENPNDWELWCLGTGDIEPIQHPQIKHFGFVQPQNLPDYIKQTSVFILPSHFEPWGVVVHEFAAAGFPIICSDKVGAVEAFVEDGKNGFVFKSGDVNELKQQLLKTIKLTNLELDIMAQNSVEKSKSITPQKWAEKICKTLNI